jgi:hypothetical protein
MTTPLDIPVLEEETADAGFPLSQWQPGSVRQHRRRQHLPVRACNHF